MGVFVSTGYVCITRHSSAQTGATSLPCAAHVVRLHAGGSEIALCTGGAAITDNTLLTEVLLRCVMMGAGSTCLAPAGQEVQEKFNAGCSQDAAAACS